MAGAGVGAVGVVGGRAARREECPVKAAGRGGVEGGLVVVLRVVRMIAVGARPRGGAREVRGSARIETVQHVHEHRRWRRSRAAVREHGEGRRSIDENVALAARQLKDLAAAGVDIDEVTNELEVEGVESFTKSFETLIAAIAQSAKDISAGKGPRQWHSLRTQQPSVDQQVSRLDKEQAARRLWAKDSTLWTADPAKRSGIRAHLG